MTAGSILALDLGKNLVGAAVTDELQITINSLSPLKRSNWKRLLLDVKQLIGQYDAKTLVIGLPLNLDGSWGDAAKEAERQAVNFSKSLSIPVFLQDERLTSVDAHQLLVEQGHHPDEISNLIDGESAKLILRDYLSNPENRLQITVSQTISQTAGDTNTNL